MLLRWLSPASNCSETRQWLRGFLGATTLKEAHSFPEEPRDVWGPSCCFWDSHRYIKRRK